VVDPAYRDTIAHIYRSTMGCAGRRKSSLAAAYARLIIVVDSAVKLAYEQRLPSDPVRLSLWLHGDDDMYGMNDWLPG